MEGGGFTLTPDVYVNTIDMAKVVVTQGTKATMLTDLKVTATHSAASTTASITTKAYLGDVGYIDISTKTPLSFDSAGKYTAGTLTLTGTEGAVDISIDATATNGPVFIIPGSSKKLNCSAL
jgi:hypothetical protein